MIVKKQNGYCVPYALGRLSGKTPNEIAEMIQCARGDGWERRQVSRVYTWETENLMGVLGLKVTAMVKKPGMTIRKWANNRMRHGDDRPWLVRITGHMLVYHAGYFYDNGTPEGAGIDAYKYSTSRLDKAWQIAA